MTPQQLTPIIFIAAVLLAVGIRIWRSSREQRFRPGSMWVVPVIFAALVAFIVAVEGYTSPLDIALMLVALAVGGAIGLYQGTHTTIRVDHTAHAMFVKMSPLGSLIFIGVLVLRMAVRYVSGGVAPAGAPATAAPALPTVHTTAGLISLLLLVLAVGVIAGLRAYLQRFYIRARATL